MELGVKLSTKHRSYQYLKDATLFVIESAKSTEFN